jgi:GT2 family glycosyltransferase
MVFSPATGRMRHRAFGAAVESLDARAARVDGVSGCAMLVRREVFERIGLLDEEYFFSFEDLDFCLRAREAGFATLSVPGASVYHQGGATIGWRSARRVYFGTRNQLKLTRRHGAGLPSVLRAVLVAAYNVAYVIRAPEGRSLASALAVARGIRDHARGRYGPDARTPR